MMTSEKNAILEKILLAHKEKEKKNYLEWDQLLKKLTAAEKKKFGLTAKSTREEVENAVEHCLGDNTMYFEAGSVTGLAFKMPMDQLLAEMDSEKTVFLEDAFAKCRTKEKKSYIKSDKLRTSLGAAGRNMFGLTTKSTALEMQKALAPFLGDNLIFFVKKGATKTAKDILFIALKRPEEEFVLEAIQTLAPKKDFALKKVASEVPLNNSEFVAIFNQLLAAGQISVAKVDEKYGITSVQVGRSSGSPSVAARPSVGNTSPPQSDRKLFQAAFEKLDNGRIYVRICNMRRELAWSEERFNLLLRELRADGTIQLHAGDISTLTEEDVNLSYTDENNSFYATMTWKK